MAVAWFPVISFPLAKRRLFLHLIRGLYGKRPKVLVWNTQSKCQHVKILSEAFRLLDRLLELRPMTSVHLSNNPTKHLQSVSVKYKAIVINGCCLISIHRPSVPQISNRVVQHVEFYTGTLHCCSGVRGARCQEAVRERGARDEQRKRESGCERAAPDRLRSACQRTPRPPGPAGGDPALTASNISPGAGSEHRSCLGFSLCNPQTVFFMGGFGFREWVFIINALMVTNGRGTGRFVLHSN